MGLIFFTRYPERVNDYIFSAVGAYSYKRDLQTLEFHLFDTEHFALEEKGDAICADARSPLASPLGRRLEES